VFLFHKPEGLIKVMPILLFSIVTRSMQYVGNFPFSTHPYLVCKALISGQKDVPKCAISRKYSFQQSTS